MLSVSITSLAQKNKLTSPLIGTWKYTTQSAHNELQTVLNMVNKEYAHEYFVFDYSNKFRHEFTDANGTIIKVLKGKWKIAGDKIRIEYTDIDYSLSVSYFFIDKDLVLGQNFSHVIFTRDMNSGNYAQK
jgi:hypothetical protein